MNKLKVINSDMVLKLTDEVKSPSNKSELIERYKNGDPFIFKEDSNYFMLPESADANELWLFKSEEFPKKWKKYQKIFSNKQIYDASLYNHNGYWYLFGTEKLSIGGIFLWKN